MSKRRMVGWQPLAVENGHTSTQITLPPATQLPYGGALKPAVAPPISESKVVAAPGQPTAEPRTKPYQASEPIQEASVSRRRMAGWQALTVAHDTAVVPAAVSAAPTQAAEQPVAAAVAESTATPQPVSATHTAPAPVTEDLPRRRMDGWEPLKVGHPATAPAVAEASEPVAEPVAEQPAPTRMDAPAAAAPKRMGEPAAAPAPAEPQVTMPEPVAPAAKTAEPAAAKPAKKELSKTAKVVLTLLGVAIVAAGLVLVAQWLRTLEPVAAFLATYDGTPTHPDGVEPGIPGWVGWQHFFNFFIIVMVIRSGLLIRNQERPEAYWTPKDGGFYSPNKKNTPAKVSIQQWIHQSFNVLWVLNGLVFYVMVFATGHWMRIVPPNWDIFPNLVSAGIQYVSMDWPAENAWVYYNALQIMTYFITVFIAGPIAVLTGLRMSTWWPQKADKLNNAFPLPVARKIHFYTMVYFILFIVVHLFLVFTTGVLHNLNMMFTARDATDWIGVAVFAGSVVATVGVAWLIKPIFISPLAEQTGKVSTR